MPLSQTTRRIWVSGSDESRENNETLGRRRFQFSKTPCNLRCKLVNLLLRIMIPPHDVQNAHHAEFPGSLETSARPLSDVVGCCLIQPWRYLEAAMPINTSSTIESSIQYFNLPRNNRRMDLEDGGDSPWGGKSMSLFSWDIQTEQQY